MTPGAATDDPSRVRGPRRDAYLLAMFFACGAGCGGGSTSARPASDAAVPDAATSPDATAGALYGAHGPLATASCVVSEGAAVCTPASDAGSASALYVVFYPEAIAQSSGRAPLLTWGNGTGATPDQYSMLLTHLASWGFVVVASTNPNTGTGREMLAAEDFLVAADADPASPFHGKLDVAHVGAIGHSQGSDGAAHALLGADAPASGHAFIETLVSIEPPGQQWTCYGSADPSCPAEQSFDATSLRSGSVFFVDGSKDSLISPPTQSPDTTGEQSVAAYYAATPATTPRARATRIGADHNDIQDHCAPGFGCAGVGPGGYLGYITAWLRYTLAGDAAAGLAFRGAAPAIDGDPAWEDATQAALPQSFGNTNQ